MWNPELDPNNRIIQPQGLPLAVISVLSIFVFLSVLLTAVRTYVRAADRVFGWDDALMVLGCLSYVAATVVGIWAELIGIGTKDVGLNQWQFEQSKKIHTIWLLVYVIPMCVVKASICITLLRIAGSKRILRNTVWVLLAITAVSFVAAFVGTTLQCRPFEAQWKPQLVEQGKATCAAIEIFVALGYIATVCTIVTDAALVVVPGLVLWKSQMQAQAKLQVFGLLSVGSTASLITIVRIPFVQRYSNLENQHYWIATIVLCSHIETGVGCIAASFPSLRRLVLRLNAPSTEAGGSNVSSKLEDLVTFGSKPPKGSGKLGGSRDRFKNPTDVGISLATVQGRGSRSNTWRRLTDTASENGDLLAPGDNHIHAEYTFAVEIDPARTRESTP